MSHRARDVADALARRLAPEIASRLPGGAFDRLAAWGELLLAHNRRSNLIGPMDAARVACEVIADSLELLPLLDGHRVERAVDVGSGAGIPGVPLAIACPQIRWLLIEPREKRTLFLLHARRALALPNVDVLRARMDADDVPDDVRSFGASLAVSRAVFSPDAWIATGTSAVAPDGLIAVWRNVGGTADEAPTANKGTDAGALDAARVTLVARRAYRTRAGVPREVEVVRVDATRPVNSPPA